MKMKSRRQMFREGSAWQRMLSGLMVLCLLLTLLPGAVMAEEMSVTEPEDRGSYTYGNGDVIWDVENVNFFVDGQTILVDGYTIAEFNDSAYNADNGGNLFNISTGYAAMFSWAKKSFVDNQPQMLNYTAIVIEYLNNGLSGVPEYFVDRIVSGDGIFANNHSMINIAPKTDKGFVLYIPTALLTEENLPSKGDLVSTNFDHSQDNIIVGNDGWFYPDGDITGTEYHLDTIGSLDFIEKTVEDTVIETVEGTHLNATVKMFDYDEEANSLFDGYYFWNGDYGAGAAFESVDGWGAELIDVNGNKEFANPNEGGNTTRDAYHGYNSDPVVATYLSEAGYPVILDKTPGEDGSVTNMPIALDALFDGSYQVGSTMTGGGGLFQKDEKGYYYYDSLQNAAYFDGTDFTLYKNLVIRPWADSRDSSEEAYGNFLPLNQLTATNITRDGYVFSDDRTTIVNYDNKPQGSLEASGMSEAAALKVLADGNNRLREEIITDDPTTVFDESGRITARLEDKTNLWFGMTVEFDFYQPYGGVIDTSEDGISNSEDMIFDFHGDDDVMVYIGVWNGEDYDYKLVLDISGVHGAYSGNINFKSGAVSYQKSGATVNTTLKDIFDLSGDTFADYSRLNIKFFYMERGGNISYCRLRFNMPTLPDNSLTVKKQVEASDGSDFKDYVLDAHSYMFRVVKTDENGQPTEELLIPESTPYTIIHDSKKSLTTGVVGADGIFKLRAGESAQFSDLIDLTNRGTEKYVVQEVIPLSELEQYAEVGYTINGTTGTVVGVTGETYITYSTAIMDGNSTQLVVFRNNADVEKLCKLSISKVAAPLSNLVDGDTYRIFVWVGDSPESFAPVPVGAGYTIDGLSYTVQEEGLLLLRVGQTAVLDDAFLAGTTFAVYEEVPEGSNYMPIYSGTLTVDGTVTDIVPDDDSISDTLTVGGYVRVTVTNSAPFEILPDTVVVDFGLPIEIHVLENDEFGENGTLVALGNVPGNMAPTYDLSDSFAEKYGAKYGTAVVDGDAVVYTPTTMSMPGEDTFCYVVKYAKNDEIAYFYGTATVVPATTIYYEDDFVDFTGTWATTEGYQGGTQGEDRPGEFEFPDYDTDYIYGYDPAYNASTTYSLGSARYAHVTAATYEQNGAWPTASFTFTGTGFDLISLTSNQTGFITCRVYQGTQTEIVYKDWVVDTYYGYSRAIDTEYPWVEYTWTYNGERWTGVKTCVAEKTKEETTELPSNPQKGDVYIQYKENYIWMPATGANDLYQIPVIKSPELAYGTYTVVVTPTYIPFFDHTGTGGYDFYLDAVRIYAPAENMEGYYQQDGEAWPQYVELRKQLLTTDESGNATGYVNGISFIDGVSNGLISDYEAYGPNNEIYLNSNQAVAFAVDSKGQTIANVHVGLKIFNEAGTITAAALNAAGETLSEKTITTTSHTDLYYSLTSAYVPVEGSNVSNVIVLTNTGSSPITLTTLKITYGAEPTADSELVMDLEKMQAAAGYVKRKVTIDLPVSKTLAFSMGHSVNFESDLQMNYRIKLAELADFVPETAYLTVEKDVYPAEGEPYVETVTLQPDLTSDPSRMIFTLTGLQSVEMGSELRATLRISDTQGREYSSRVDTYSILAYAQLCFDSYSYEAEPALYSLLMDTLNYGAAAQSYFGRRTDCLVTAGMEAYQQYATSNLVEELNDTKVTTESQSSLNAVSRLGFTVSFKDKTELNVKLTLVGGVTEITYVKVTDSEGNMVATLTDFAELSDGRLQVTYSGIKATQLRQMYYFTAYAGEQLASPTCGYSVEAYVRSCINGSDLALAQLVRSCMYYGDSAANYFALKGAESE